MSFEVCFQWNGQFVKKKYAIKFGYKTVVLPSHYACFKNWYYIGTILVLYQTYNIDTVFFQNLLLYENFFLNEPFICFNKKFQSSDYPNL